MKNLKLAIPILLLFAFPWVEHFAYMNILWAAPGIEDVGAHLAAVVTAIGIFLSSMYILEELS